MKKQKSVFIRLVLVIILTIIIGMSAYSSYVYLDTKEQMTSDLKNSSQITSISLQRNLAPYIESYSVHEYETLILNEMGHNDIYAIIIDDYNMAKVLGQESYITGKIRDEKWNIIDYDVNNVAYNTLLHNSFFIEKKDILNPQGIKVGSLSIYTSNHFLDEKLYSIIKNSFFTSILLSIILIFFLYLAMNMFVFKSLYKIIEIIQDSDEEGIPKRYALKEDSKEMSLLVNAMNNMIDAIKHSRLRLKEQEAVLIHQAHYDSLTDLPNRVLFQDRLEQGILKSKRDQTKLALFFIDLDQFKEINDSYGHDVGDELLKIVTQRLQVTLRAHDTLARLGGDEFTVIAEDMKGVDDISYLAQKILDNLNEAIVISNKVVYVSSSIGISLYPDDGDNAQVLLKYADSAMYKAKDDGRNTFRFYSSYMTESAYEKVSMETDMRKALENEEFVVYYQPQVNALQNSIVGMEALVRWEHPEQGLIPPVKFLPIAESTGLILEIDKWVMKTGMTQIAKWHGEGLNPGSLAINLVMKQLQDENCIDLIMTLMEETHCLAKWLELEVTEGQIMRDPKRAIEILNTLSSMGINIAIDDFGTGYSSLAYLKKLPIDKLKIDKSFVDNLPDDEEDVVISKTIISLAQNLRLSIIAEGVETKEQKDFLLKNGCSNIQGYFYSKPIPAKEMEVLLREGLAKT